MERVETDLGQVVAAVCGLVLFGVLFLDWAGASNAWELFDVIDLVLGGIALLAMLVCTSAWAGARFVPWPAAPVLLYAGLVAVIFVLATLFESGDRKIGIYLGLFAAAGIALGGYISLGERDVSQPG